MSSGVGVVDQAAELLGHGGGVGGLGEGPAGHEAGGAGGGDGGEGGGGDAAGDEERVGGAVGGQADVGEAGARAAGLGGRRLDRPGADVVDGFGRRRGQLLRSVGRQ